MTNDERTLGELRAERNELHEQEDTVSYARRLAQGRLDLVRAEREMRAQRENRKISGELPSIMGRLSTGSDRPPRDTEVPSDHPLLTELNHECTVLGFDNIKTATDEQLHDLRVYLTEYIDRRSQERQALFDRIDVLTVGPGAPLPARRPDRGSARRHERRPDLTTPPVSEVGALIRRSAKAARSRWRDLAKSAGVSNPYLSQIERGLRRPSAEILQQLAKALKVSVETLYVRAGILPADDAPDIAVPDAINREPAITPEQKQSLLTVYESFRTRERLRLPRELGVCSHARVVVLGAGSWGTTVASLVARRHQVLLWARDPEVADEVDLNSIQPLATWPDHPLPERLRATADLEEAAAHAERARRRRAVGAFRATLEEAAGRPPPVDPGRQPHQGLETGPCCG